jgi:diguanylate cyclase (GGDEF)-like protein
VRATSKRFARVDVGDPALTAHESVATDLHDMLTSLPNRRALLALLDERCARATTLRTPLALMFVNVEGCAIVNQTQGFPAGDALIAQAAMRLLDALAQAATLTHFGAEHFVAVFDGADAVEALPVVAERIVTAFAAPLVVRTSVVYAKLGIGIAHASDEHETVDRLMRNATTALLEARAAGRNAIRVFSPAMRDRVAESTALDADLRLALGNEEMSLHYQPIVAPSGRVIAFETLARWQHPDRGTISPQRFIPLAEESGVIIPLGRWILQRACADFALIKRRFPAARLAVNISTRQLHEPDFEPALRRILSESAFDPSRLELEITESVMMADLEAVLPVLERFRGVGVRISLDDFGTGYSSLAYLRRLPVDTLKIDQRFVRDIAEDELDGEIARAIVALAHSLGLRVIAEGVETEMQRAFLEYLGCDELQGYLFGHPRSPAALLGAPARAAGESRAVATSATGAGYASGA